MKSGKYLPIVILICVGFAVGIADAQENLAQQAYAIFEQQCLNCHGEHGAFTEEIIIEYTALIETGAVVPGKPIESELYRRLLENDPAKRMPLGQPQLSAEAILTIGNWIQAGAPDWADTSETGGPFVTPTEMLETIENHVNSLSPFDRTFARYFTSTHLYNAGETTETLRAYQRALSKLVNSLSWGREVIKPQPIDPKETIFYIDLRDYEWELGTNRWTLIETEYPYKVEFNAPTQTNLREKLISLQEEMACEVPFIHVDWFLATASLPPLYHDILGLPETDRELEARLEVNVVENLRNAARIRVWRAGFNDSGVSNHNRVVERHKSRYGAYWKSYDFAGSVGTQNIFTHPLNFTHDGGEIIFNLPNRLQAYYLADAGGNRLDEAPISIVSNPAASDPTVRNGLSCIGCHTEGMKTFEDQVRGVVEQNENPSFDKERALRLYVEKSEMDALIEEDTEHYRQALEETGDVFGGIEPIQRFYEAFQRPLDTPHAAAAVGLETETFLQRIRSNKGLQNLGLIVLENGTVKRDTWTAQFSEVLFALDFPEESEVTPVDPQTERIPGESVYIPDPNLRAAIAEALGKTPGAVITVEEMGTLERFVAENKNISDLTGLEFAKNLTALFLNHNALSDILPLAALTKLREIGIAHNPLSDISPLASLTRLRYIRLHDTEVSDLSPLAALRDLEDINVAHTRISSLAPLAGLKNLQKLDTISSDISDLSPLAGLTNLTRLLLYNCKATNLSPLKGLTKLRWLGFAHSKNITDFSPLAGLTKLRHLDLFHTAISDISPLAGMTNLETLILDHNRIVDISPLASLHNLKNLRLHVNNISDFSPLDGIRENLEEFTWFSNPGFPQGGPKVEGPWSWLLLLPMGSWDRDELLTDYLAEASEGKVTEQQIAAHGATVGDMVGDSTWSVGTLEPYNNEVHENKFHASTFRNNVNNLTRLLILDEDEIEEWYGRKVVAYGSITLYSPRPQDTQIFMGASLARKVWLNGQLVYDKYINENWNFDYQEFFPVTLKKGRNVVLVAAGYSGFWNFFFGFEPGTEYQVFNPSVGYTFSDSKIYVGDTFTLDISVEDVIDLAGWQFDIAFDPAVLEAVEVSEGDFLKTGGGTAFFQKGTIDNTTGKITKLSSAKLSDDGVSGTGTLLSVTFTAKTTGETRLALHNFQLGSTTGEIINAGPHEVVITIEGQRATGDVNRDGQVSVLDMILVAQHFGEDASINSQADVNRDGTINIQDLIIVSQHLGESTTSAAPSAIAIDDDKLNPAMIQAWITQAQAADDGSLAFQQGIANLERLLALFIPEETALLHNYPNPFNPETWIPYQLAEPADVTLSIYSVNGALVRMLILGHQPAGIYQTRTRAAYWDGKNQVGEPVASGVYFYTFTADDFTATRKMLIRK